jgi:predicted RNase H-like HicB family nuclease
VDRKDQAMALYDLRIEVKELHDGGGYGYIATSPDLPDLIVVGDTTEEVLTLAPQVASALIASMKAAGDALPATLQEIPSLPFTSHVIVPT